MEKNINKSKNMSENRSKNNNKNNNSKMKTNVIEKNNKNNNNFSKVIFKCFFLFLLLCKHKLKSKNLVIILATLCVDLKPLVCVHLYK